MNILSDFYEYIPDDNTRNLSLKMNDNGGGADNFVGGLIW